jgi:hypothetical protein
MNAQSNDTATLMAVEQVEALPEPAAPQLVVVPRQPPTRPGFFNIRRSWDVSKPLAAQLQDTIEVLMDCQNPCELLALNGSGSKLKPGVQAVREAIDGLAELIGRTAADNAKAPSSPYLTSVERRALVRDLALKIADTEKAVIVDRPALHALAHRIADEGQRQWLETREGELWGLFTGGDVALAASLREAGIIVWEGKLDHLVRMVTPRWLKTHEAIWRFVRHDPLVGRCCRLCGLLEPSTSREIDTVSVDVPGSFTGRAAGFSLHKCCVETWLEWLDTASRYRSAEDAAAADREAGREPEVIGMHFGWRGFKPLEMREVGAA